MTQTRPDPLLRRILAEVGEGPTTVSASFGAPAPVTAAAASKLATRLRTVAEMHADGQLSDAQLVAVSRAVLEACETTSVLHHMLSPEQVAASAAATDRELALELSEEDLAELSSIHL